MSIPTVYMCVCVVECICLIVCVTSAVGMCGKVKPQDIYANYHPPHPN